MHGTDEAVRVRATNGIRTALVVAVAASAVAGMLHAVAAGSHGDERTLVWLFSLCAFAQAGWAAAALVRPGRAVLVVGMAINAGALAVWALTRTVGISFVDALADPESVSTPDLTAAIFAGVSVIGAGCLLARPRARFTLAPAYASAFAAVLLAAGVPALAASHSHGGAGHTHGDGTAAHDHGDGSGEGASAPHSHEDGEEHSHEDGEAHSHADGQAHDHADGADHAHDPSDPNHSHAHDPSDPNHSHDPSDPNHSHDPSDPNHPHDPTDPNHPHDPTDPTHPHDPTDPNHPHDPTGPVISLDDPRVTAPQRAAAQSLLDRTHTAMARFPNVAAVQAAGYTSIGDASTGFEHFVNFGYLSDGAANEINPDRIESIVARVNPDGSKSIVSAMYILSLGRTMANVPDIAGSLTTWHDHQDLCWVGARVVGIAVNGVCASGTLIPTPPMLHVWSQPYPACGPFAGIETDGASSHGTDCGHSHEGPTGPIISLDDPRVTSAQRAAAQALIDRTRAGMARFPTVASVQAAGYVSIGDGGSNGYEHFIHVGYMADGAELDQNRIESIVMRRLPGGGREIVSAMYILNFGKTMANVPDIAGELTTWHDHQNLCFEGTTLVGLAVNGVCARGGLLPTPPMLHVWMTSHPCGPFAGIESHGGGSGCGHDH
jgi:hypothetical protein